MKSLITLLTVCSLVACGTADSGTGDPTTPDPSTQPELLPQSYAVSGCGGFTESYAKTQLPPQKDYCAAEVLRWAYDAPSGTLTFSNDRVLLNCCGERTMTISETQGGYVLKQTDAPEAFSDGKTARCNCMCVFDLKVQAEQVAGGKVTVQLEREITDSGAGAQQLFQGQLDLDSGSGTVVIDSTEAFMDAGGRCSPE